MILLTGIKCSHVFHTFVGRGHGLLDLYYSLHHVILYSQTETVRRRQL